MIRTPNVKARLARDRHEVLCGTCSKSICEVHEAKTKSGSRRQLVLPSAWGRLWGAEVEFGMEVWTLSKRGRKNLQRGLPAVNRRKVRTAPEGVVTTGRLPDERVPGESYAHPSALPELPCVLVCPTCGKSNLADPTRLDVSQ